MASKALSVLRDHLTAHLDASDGSMVTRELVAEFRRAHASAVKAATSDLVDLALAKQVDSVSRRRRKAGDPHQGDLFPGASVPHVIVVSERRGGRVHRVRKPFLRIRVSEAQAYLDRKPRTREPKPDAGVVAILERIRPYVTSPGMTIAEGLAAAEAAEAGKRAVATAC